MKKTRVNKGVIAGDELDRMLAVQAARSAFAGASLNLGWRLALTVLVPVIIGVKLDERFNTSPSYTLTALVLAAGGVCMVVAQAMKYANQGRRPRHKRSNSSRVKGNTSK